MGEEIWIRSGDKVVGPGTVEQFLNAFRKGTLRANSTFSTQSSGNWLPLSEFPPAAPLALKATGWFWVRSGFASDEQIGPCSGEELLGERGQQIGKATAVVHNVFTRGEWVEFQTTLLEVTHQNALAAIEAEALIARQKQEQLRLEQIQLEREQQEAEAARQQQIAEQQTANRLAEEQARQRELSIKKSQLDAMVKSGELSVRRCKVLTQKDKWFSGKFDPQLLEDALNAYGEQGWELDTAVTATIPGVSFGGNKREEVVFILGRKDAP